MRMPVASSLAMSSALVAAEHHSSSQGSGLSTEFFPRRQKRLPIKLKSGQSLQSYREQSRTRSPIDLTGDNEQELSLPPLDRGDLDPRVLTRAQKAAAEEKLRKAVLAPAKSKTKPKARKRPLSKTADASTREVEIVVKRRRFKPCASSSTGYVPVSDDEGLSVGVMPPQTRWFTQHPAVRQSRQAEREEMFM